jgi:hypothetical protein
MNTCLSNVGIVRSTAISKGTAPNSKPVVKRMQKVGKRSNEVKIRVMQEVRIKELRITSRTVKCTRTQKAPNFPLILLPPTGKELPLSLIFQSPLSNCRIRIASI